MVSKKKLVCGSNGFTVPNIPRAPRSCRRKSLCKKTDEDSQICAFDLLASLAGKLLQEIESFSSSSNALDGHNHSDLGKEVNQEQQDEIRPFKTEFTDRGSSGLKSSKGNAQEKCLLNEFLIFEDDGILERASASGCFDKKDGCDFPSKLKGCFAGKSCDVTVNKQPREESDGSRVANTCPLKDAAELHMAFPKLIKPEGDVKLPSCRDPVPNASFTRHRIHTKSGSRADDENFFRFYKFSKKYNSYRPPARIRDRRIRKLLASKYWKAAPKIKDFEYIRAVLDPGLKTAYHKRKRCDNYNGCQHDTNYKRKKLSDGRSVVTSVGGFCSESVLSSPEKGDTVNGVLSPLRFKDSHVKFSIKSFKIPELLLEVPETTTVGSLKRTVMEAVAALIGSGMRVGVLVQGKKVRDNNKTLSQTGISCKENLDNLGFTLEPGHVKAPSTVCSEDPLSLPSDAINLSKRFSASPTLDSGIPNSCPDLHMLTNSDNQVENNHELVPYQTETSTDQPISDSRALVPVPAMNVEALAVVSVNQKPKRSELAQRRTRRPFSVSEVEALVQAVEELGTGRWRDVKLRAFENADHRTCVDLKDKWKTLVRTASISPQQRRGEPVPQELLDRVLAAHAYWSQHQVKQHGKIQSNASKIMDVPTADTNCVGTLQLV